MRTCTKCGHRGSLDDFQKDKRCLGVLEKRDFVRAAEAYLARTAM